MTGKENKHTMSDLYQMQSLPLSAKVRMTAYRIREFVNVYGTDGVYVSFSGGKDSTVLGHIVRNVCGYDDIPFVFCDVPTQYPELKQFAMTYDNLTIVRPKISFLEVCEKYGFPLISKEVSECVSGARKYLTSILQENTISEQASKQASKQCYKYYFEKVTGTGTYSKFSNTPSNVELVREKHLETIRGGNDTNTNTKSHICLEQYDNQAIKDMSRGGYDNKYRKLRGIGEYSKQPNEKQDRRQQSKVGNHARNVDERQGKSDKGEYP